MIRRVSYALLPLVTYLSRPMWAQTLFIVLLALTLLMDGDQCLAQSQPPVSIFSNALPAHAVDSSGGATTLGVKFWSSQPGTISTIRFYRGANSPNGYVASLYSADGSTLLGSVTMATESGPVPGWQQAIFAVPIPIAANTTYVAAYYAPSGQYAYTSHGLNQTLSNGPLNAPAASLVGGNGVYSTGRAFPNRDYKHTNFFVDVAFASAGLPHLNMVTSPANPTIPSAAPPGTKVAQIVVTWSDGSPFTGTLSFGAPNFDSGGTYALDSNKNLIVSPLGRGVGSAGGSTENVTIVATQ